MKREEKGGKTQDVGNRAKERESRPTYANNESSALAFEYLRHIFPFKRRVDQPNRAWPFEQPDFQGRYKQNVKLRMVMFLAWPSGIDHILYPND